MTTAKKPRTSKKIVPFIHPLKGRYFHTWKDGTINWQGRVIDVLNGDQLLVQTYSWLMGEDFEQLIIPLSQTIWDEGTKTGWSFYDDRETFLHRYERYEEKRKFQQEEAGGLK